jgi:hypothetical protein
VKEIITARKMWLFATGCCRRVWHLLLNPNDRALVKATEQRAEGALSRTEWEDAVARNPRHERRMGKPGVRQPTGLLLPSLTCSRLTPTRRQPGRPFTLSPRSSWRRGQRPRLGSWRWAACHRLVPPRSPNDTRNGGSKRLCYAVSWETRSSV